jgi:hypothetical protein
MVENLCLLFQDVTTVHIDHYGSLRDWIHKASDKKYWNKLVNCLLHPSTLLPEHPTGWGPLPSWCAHQAANNTQHPANHHKDNKKTTTKTMTTTETTNWTDATTPPPHHHNTHPTHASCLQAAPFLPPDTNPNVGSMTPIFVHKLDIACFIHSQFSGLGSEHPRLNKGPLPTTCLQIPPGQK